MAKKVTGYIKLQIPAGKATPAPPVGPALGQHGVNIVQFTKEFNARTADQGDLIIPVVITVYADRSFSLSLIHIYIPKFLLVVQKMLVNGFKMVISFGLVIIMMVIYQVPVTWKILYFFPLMLVLVRCV